MAAKDLTTLANVKQAINITDTNSDALLALMITRASAYIINFLNREIKSASFSDVRNGNGLSRFRTLQWPITAVASVSVDGTNIPLSPDGKAAGYIFDDKYIYLTQGAVFNQGLRNVTVNYTGGYTTVPEDVEMAVIELIAKKYKDRSRVGLTSEALNGMTTSFSQKDIGDDMMAILDNYQRKFIPI